MSISVTPRLNRRLIHRLKSFNPIKQIVVTRLLGRPLRWLRLIFVERPPDVASTVVSAPVSVEGGTQVSVASPKIDAGLVQRLRAGNNDAWDEFVDVYSPKLFAYLRYKLPTSEDAEDVLNETFGAAVRAIQNFDGRASLLTWLAAIARNKIANYYKAMPEPSEPEEMAENMPAPTVSFSLEFREALDVIPPHIRQALLLRYRQGFSVSEIAELTGRTYKSVESLLSRGRALLAALLGVGKA
jgi:RNA polymerase sigma-70 factor, ECF subfamily